MTCGRKQSIYLHHNVSINGSLAYILYNPKSEPQGGLWHQCQITTGQSVRNCGNMMILSFQPFRSLQKLFGCTPLKDPNVQGRLIYFLKKSKKKKKKSNFLPKIVFLKISKHKTYQKIDKNVSPFIKYSWQALLLCNKPFDLLKILVFVFTLSSELQNHKICIKGNKNKKQTKKQTNKKIWLIDPVFFRHWSTTKQWFFFFFFFFCLRKSGKCSKNAENSMKFENEKKKNTENSW